MAQLTAADPIPYPSCYDSDREVGDVLLGEDTARPLIEASASGNETVLQSLLSQPQYIQTMLENPHCIYAEERPREGPNDVRSVSAMQMSNVERALAAAAETGDAAAAAVSALPCSNSQCAPLVNAHPFLTKMGQFLKTLKSNNNATKEDIKIFLILKRLQKG